MCEMYSGTTAQMVGMVRGQLRRLVMYEQGGMNNKPEGFSVEDRVAEEIYRTGMPLTSVTDEEIGHALQIAYDNRQRRHSL